MSFQRPSFWRVPRNKPQHDHLSHKKKVGFASPVSNTLQRGDIIKKIDNYDSRDIRHQDAQNLFQNAGTNIKVVVQRETGNAHNTSTASSRCSSHTPLSVSPHLSPRGPGQQMSLGSPGYGPAYAPALQPYQGDPFTNLPEGYYSEIYAGAKKRSDDDNDIENLLNQPYRTTPLVLPGAKVKREGGLTESYLRHHPNPSVRSAPHHVDHDYLMKQRVADSVIQKVVTDNKSNLQIAHKQFNSPIGLYSEHNIVDTIKHQTGITPTNGTMLPGPKGKCISKKYDPLLSATYHAIQEEQHGEMQDVLPIQPKVFTSPGKLIPAKKQVIHHPPPHSPPTHLNSMGVPETIQQSGSFKRLMYHVMADN